MNLKSIVMDTRIKLIIFLIINFYVFGLKTVLLGSMMFLCVALISLLMGQVRITGKYVLTYIILVAVSVGAMYLPAGFMSFVSILALFMRVMLPVLLFANVFIETTTVGELVAAMYALHLPKSIVITFTMTLRFFPTFKEEIGRIYDAMKLRGLELSAKNIFKRPAVIMEAAVVPIIMRSLSIAEELSASAVTRGIDNPNKRTSFIELRLKKEDIIILLFVFIYGAMLFVLKYHLYGRIL